MTDVVAPPVPPVPPVSAKPVAPSALSSSAPAGVSVPNTPTPGWKTSEAWISLLAVVLGAIPSSGLVANAPLAAKIVGMLVALLTALGYMNSRTSLKRAHLQLLGNPPQSSPIGNNKITAVVGAATGAALVAALAFAPSAFTHTTAMTARPATEAVTRVPVVPPGASFSTIPRNVLPPPNGTGPEAP
jgi:hypothetical protein